MPAENRRVLLIEDNELSIELLSSALNLAGCQATPVKSLRDALDIVQETDFDAALIDEDFRETELLEVIRRIKKRNETLSVLLLTSPGNIPTALKGLRQGLDDYLTKPLDTFEMRKRLGRIFEKHDLNFKISFFQEEMTKRYSFKKLVNRSEPMKSLMSRIARIAPMRSTVLILGESGVGKELVARAIHLGSPRREMPFIALNCSAIPEQLIESELFGHERGSFTGAISRAKGKFEIADGGTLFLDEIGEMNLASQVKLLRVLEEKEFMRVGGIQNVRVDVRLIAATNADLEKLSKEGRFRKDLLYRLKVITLYVPALRQRVEDIPDLIHIFIEEICRMNNMKPRSITPEAIDVLKSYHWPGNVRELKNILESLIVSTPADVLHIDDIPLYIRGEKISPPRIQSLQSGMSLREVERELIQKTLEHVKGNRTRAARMLQIGLRTLQRKIKSYHLG
ncbi:MAG: sigma-54 dependent transcriptional regulator [Acidobacteriota bacterium]